MSSIWNNRISISIFGESNGPAIGVTVDNLPSGEYIDTDQLTRFMARRNIGRNQVRENIMPHVISGIYNDRTTGSPLCAFIQNKSVNAPQHSALDKLSRTGHADYTGAVRYRGINDFREEGHFTDRLTIPLCFAGAVCAQILERRGIYTGAHVARIHNVKDNPYDPVNITRDGVLSIRDKDFPVINDRRGWLMQDDIRKAREVGESLGGVIECASVNVPAGVGAPIFDGLKNNIAQLIFGITGVNGLEFGIGFRSARMVGSQNNDDFYVNERGYVLSKTNNHGGIIGGISSGMPITLNVAVKPVITNLENGDEIQETCIVPSTVASVEAAVNIALLSHMIDYPNFC